MTCASTLGDTTDERSHLGPDRVNQAPVPGVRQIDHTADLGMEVEASDLRELFRRAALGMVGMVTDAPPVGAEQARTVTVEGPDLPGLFHHWLREILFCHDEDGFIPIAVELEGLEELEKREEPEDLEMPRLRARLLGTVTESGLVREIKGVTWHGLTVSKRSGRWYARVVFDV